MISAIVASLDSENLLATPSGDTDPATLVGYKVQYIDKSGKAWFGIVKGADDTFIIVKLDPFPTGLGQGQLLDVFEDGDA